jgi:hypothetical protein
MEMHAGWAATVRRTLGVGAAIVLTLLVGASAMSGGADRAVGTGAKGSTGAPAAVGNMPAVTLSASHGCRSRPTKLYKSVSHVNGEMTVTCPVRMERIRVRFYLIRTGGGHGQAGQGTLYEKYCYSAYSCAKSMRRKDVSGENRYWLTNEVGNQGTQVIRGAKWGEENCYTGVTCSGLSKYF